MSGAGSPSQAFGAASCQQVGRGQDKTSGAEAVWLYDPRSSSRRPPQPRHGSGELEMKTPSAFLAEDPLIHRHFTRFYGNWHFLPPEHS